MIVPRVFHRIWVGPREMPQQFEVYWQGWRENHPGWELVTWTDDALEGLGLVNKAEYDGATLAAGRADIAMHEVLYRFGGVFLCCDMECFKNIEPLVGELTAFAGRQQADTILGAIMGITAGHDISRALVEGIPESVKVNSGPSLPDIAGPVYLTRTLERILGVTAAEMDGREDFTVLAAKYVYPYLWTQPYLGREAYPEAYAAHHWTGSWTR